MRIDNQRCGRTGRWTLKKIPYPTPQVSTLILFLFLSVFCLSLDIVYIPELTLIIRCYLLLY